MWDNRKEFTLSQIPKLHPLSHSYLDFWRGEKKKVIEGVWINGVWCPPQLYHYLNYATIVLGEKKTRKKDRPWDLDYVWDLAYYWIEARGLSGFEKVGDVPDIRAFLRQRQSEDLGKPLYNNEAKNLLLMGPRGWGKDLEENTTVYKKDSCCKIKDIQVGDQIFGYDGKLTTVTDKKVFTDQLQYIVELKDGRSIECGGGHLWTVIDCYGKEKTLQTKDLLKNYKLFRNDSTLSFRYFLSYTAPLQYDPKPYSINPYYLGLWLGDGNSHNTGITTVDKEIYSFLYNYAKDFGAKLSVVPHKNSVCCTYVINNGLSKTNCLLQNLREADLLHNKHIPEEYFYGSVEQRMELLRGLMDTDGSITKEGTIEFSNANEKLIKDVIRLLNSLGIRNSVSQRMGSYTKNGVKKLTKVNYRIRIITSQNIFKLPRKLTRLNTNLKSYSKANREKVAIVNIYPTSVKPSVCIAVDNDKSLFLAGDYVVTHNSYWGANVATHEYLTDGQKEYTPGEIPKETAEILLSAYNSPYVNDLISKIQDVLNNYPGGMEVNGVYYPPPFFKTLAGTWAIGKKAENYYKKKVGGKWQMVGTRSCFKPRVYKDKPLAGVGGRNTVKIGEEIGLWENLIESHFADENTQRLNNYKFGSTLYIGTGGDMVGGGTLASQKMFYDPEAYDCLVFEDIYENRGKIGLFFPSTYTKINYKDGFGNTNFSLAKAGEEDQREKKKLAKDAAAYDEYVVYNPIVPSEVFLSRTNNIFPLKDLQYALAHIEASKLADAEWIGDVIISPEGEVEWRNNAKNRPIYDFPLRAEANVEGSVVLYEHPIKDENGNIPWGRYIGGIDPYDHDKSNSGSLGSIIILDNLTNRIVAEYSGRPETANDFYEICRRLLLYFNALALYENEKKGVFTYFESCGALYLLAKQPKLVKDVVANSTVDRGYGMHMPQEIKRYGEGLINTWLRRTYEGDIKVAHKIRCIPLLKELILYNPDGNFDRVMALMLVLYQKEEMRKYEIQVEEKVKTFLDHDFFNTGFTKKGQFAIGKAHYLS